MPYNVNKANGNLLVTIQDGTLNTSATPFKLPGRNYSGYGEAIAENFVQHLENFANTSAPNQPLPGQLWFDTTAGSGKLKFRDVSNSKWIPVGGSIAQNSAPSPALEGDLWWDSDADILYGYDSNSSDWIPVGITGGNYTVAGKTRAVYLKINEGGSGGITSNGYNTPPSGGTDYDAYGIVVGSVLIGVWSDTAINSPAYYYDPTDFDGSDVFYYGFAVNDSNIEKGLNLRQDSNGYRFNGKAATAETTDSLSGIPSVTNLMRNDSQTGATSTRLPSTSGLNIGDSSNRWDTIYANTFDGTATAALYSDLAERYEVDTEVQEGNLVSLGGNKEITLTTESADANIFGVVSSKPGFALNKEAGTDSTHPYVAFSGRVPCWVVGPVRKGQRLVSSEEPGVAKAVNEEVFQHDPTMIFAVFGRALEDKDSHEVGKIEVVVGAK